MPGTLPYVPVNVWRETYRRGATDGSAISRSVSFTIRLGRGAVILTESACKATFLEPCSVSKAGKTQARVCRRECAGVLFEWFGNVEMQCLLGGLWKSPDCLRKKKLFSTTKIRGLLMTVFDNARR